MILPDAKARIERIERCCTKPEIEVLIIIYLQQIRAYHVSRLSPKIYAKQYLDFQGESYDGSTLWWNRFLRTIDIESVLHEYKRLKRHAKDEHYLADRLV